VTYSFPVVPRYAEIDQQGVVFNAHYLIWFDEALTGFLDHLGLPYPLLIAGGTDVQVVHTELDYAVPVRWGDGVLVEVACERVGTTSFTLAFTVQRRGKDDAEETLAVSGRTVYVCIDATDATDGTKRPVPAPLGAALRAAPVDVPGAASTDSRWRPSRP